MKFGTGLLAALILVSTFAGCSTNPLTTTEYDIPGSKTDNVDSSKYFYATTGRKPEPPNPNGEYVPGAVVQYSAPQPKEPAKEAAH